MKFTTVNRILNKLSRDLPHIEINELDVIEWIGEALNAIETPRFLEEAVAFINVSNWTAELPSNFQYIIQIAKNSQVDSLDDVKSSNVADVVPEEVANPLIDEPDVPVCLTCEGQPYNDYNVAYYRPYYDLKYEYQLWMGTDVYKRCYLPVRLATGSFFNTLVCTEDSSDCGVAEFYSGLSNNGIYYPNKLEYTIVRNEILKFNFETGLIAISYIRTITDDDGLPMIPDTYSVTTAITKYITMKLMEREFYLGKEGSSSKVQKASQDWQWYARQAKSEGMMPQTVDEYENLLHQTNYMIPRRRVYDNYFGNLNRKEIKDILGTMRRNNNNTSYGRRI